MMTPWKPVEPLQRENASERLLNDVRARILSGELKRGVKIPTEKALATAYGVSSATVREAVRGLATARLVEVRHGSGAYVTADVDQLIAMSLESIIEMERVSMPQVFSVYGTMNGLAAELAARHASSSQVNLLQKAQDEIASAKTSETISTALKDFLQTLAGCSGNPLLVALCRFLAGMQIRMAAELAGDSYATRRSTSNKLAKERQTLIDAIRTKDTAAARVAAVRYHERALTVMSALLSDDQSHVDNPALSKRLASPRT